MPPPMTEGDGKRRFEREESDDVIDRAARRRDEDGEDRGEERHVG